MASPEPPPGEAIMCVRMPCREGAAQYARVSAEKQEREDTVVSQVDLLCKAPATLGYDLSPTSVFLDEGVSGTRLERPALDRLRDLAAEGAFANRAMTLFTSLGTSADCRGRTQVPTYQV